MRATHYSTCIHTYITRALGKVRFLVFSPENCLNCLLHRSNGHKDRNRVLQTLVLICGYALSVVLLTLTVVYIATHHDYNGTFQGGYSARFTASRRLRKEARALYPSKTA